MKKRRKCKYLNRIFGEIRRIFGTFFRQSTESEVAVSQRVTTDFRYIRQIFREKNFSVRARARTIFVRNTTNARMELSLRTIRAFSQFALWG